MASENIYIENVYYEMLAKEVLERIGCSTTPEKLKRTEEFVKSLDKDETYKPNN